MSAIKNYIEKTVPRYIYLYEKNYVERSKEDPIKVFKQIKSDLYSKLQFKHTQSELDDLSGWYIKQRNLLLNDTQTFEAVKRAVMLNLEESFGFDPEELYSFNWETGNITIKNDISGGSSAQVKRVKGVKVKNSQSELKKSNEATFIKRINACLDTLGRLAEDPNYSKNLSTRAKLTEGAGKIKKTLEIFQSLLGSDQKRLDTAVNELKKAGINISSGSVKKMIKDLLIVEASGGISRTKHRIDARVTNLFIKIINGIMATFRQEVLAKMRGDFLEYMFHAIKAYADKTAIKLSDDAIAAVLKQAMAAVGGNRTQGTVLMQGFSKKGDDSLSSLDILKEVEKGVVLEGEGARAVLKSTYSSQQTADFTLTLDNKNFNLSLKNYALNTSKFGHIGLRNEATLEKYLFGSDNIFRNSAYHYLNILAEHPEEGKHSNFKEIKEEGLSALAFTLLYQAFSGKMLGKTEGFADTFVWNDPNPKTGTIRFYDIDFILSQLDYDKIKYNISSPALNNLKIANKKVEGKFLHAAISQRLSEALQDTRSKKLSILLPQSELLKVVNATKTL